MGLEYIAFLASGRASKVKFTLFLISGNSDAPRLEKLQNAMENYGILRPAAPPAGRAEPRSHIFLSFSEAPCLRKTSKNDWNTLY